jgi:hypothetical protein
MTFTGITRTVTPSVGMSRVIDRLHRLYVRLAVWYDEHAQIRRLERSSAKEGEAEAARNVARQAIKGMRDSYRRYGALASRRRSP